MVMVMVVCYVMRSSTNAYEYLWLCCEIFCCPLHPPIGFCLSPSFFLLLLLLLLLLLVLIMLITYQCPPGHLFPSHHFLVGSLTFHVSPRSHLHIQLHSSGSCSTPSRRGLFLIPNHWPTLKRQVVKVVKS